MTRTLPLVAAGLLSLAVAAPALAQATQAPARKTLEQVVTDLSAKGYTIREIEMDDGHFEATVITPEKVRSEAKIDGVTGEILRIKPKD
ncbi:hypothetical protein J2Y48_004692 [Mycoplana sp. BE70]|uniref:PepSY domain-containing protein n=1 Tax=Mycoplana sp. BE70 TaxID=2817775 RepID=UPI0028616C30|nr:PepSY domain-containing protein [Mycoplana sp. BE70]MDR6759376.1 hypothetical protein [Mycoplana sp. BE70]